MYRNTFNLEMKKSEIIDTFRKNSLEEMNKIHDEEKRDILGLQIFLSLICLHEENGKHKRKILDMAIHMLDLIEEETKKILKNEYRINLDKRKEERKIKLLSLLKNAEDFKHKKTNEMIKNINVVYDLMKKINFEDFKKLNKSFIDLHTLYLKKGVGTFEEWYKGLDLKIVNFGECGYFYKEEKDLNEISEDDIIYISDIELSKLKLKLGGIIDFAEVKRRKVGNTWNDFLKESGKENAEKVFRKIEGELLTSYTIKHML